MGGVSSATATNKTATDSKLTQSSIQDSTHSSANTEANKLTESANSNVQAGQSNDSVTSNKVDSTNVENKTTVLNTGNKQTSVTKADLRDEKVAAVSAESTPAKELRGTQTAEASDWQSLVNALNDANNGTIKLTSDITVANKGTNVNGINRPNLGVNGGKMNLTGSNISGGLDIDGQGHVINFGANYLSFTTNNQKDSNPWDITFKNMTINADGYDNSWSTLGGAFSPIYMGGDDIRTDLLANNKVTFENVTADIKNGAFYTTTMAQQTTDNPYTTVTFKGNNNITCEAVNVKGNQLYNYSSAVSASHIIFVDGSDTTFNVSSAKTNNDQNAGGNILRAKVEDETNDTAPAIDVQQGATVTLNGNSTDVKGMLVNSAITGTVQVDGNLNANMADGHSMAIWAGNLNIGKNGVVNIKTKQSNDGSGINGVGTYNGYHFAPISLGVGFAANVSNAVSNVLDNQGKLRIVRTGDNNQSTSPLISFGSGNGTGAEFSLNVADGATMDLQDGATSSIKGDFTNTPNIGIVTMWGNGGTSGSAASTYANININNPAYVNFQRTGSQTGTLLRLENMNNHVNISSDGEALPLALWEEANKSAGPSYYWYINQLKNQNNWGDNSISGFAQTGNTVGQNKKGEIKFLHSNGEVNLAQNQAGLNSYQFIDGTVTQGQPADGIKYETPYLNRLLNNFNWWNPQRVAMGSSLEEVAKPTDSDQYQPVVKTIDGNTRQTLNDLTAKDGISGLRTSDGTITPDLSAIKSVTWYDAATDATEWNTLMNGQDAPTNPTGNLKTSDTSAWAKVTYTDGSIDFANIPLNITVPMADTYTPSYNPVTVEQGQSATAEPNFVGQDGKETSMPTGSTFTTGANTPSWANVDPSTGIVTVNPSVDVIPGAYNVPVTVTYPDKSIDETNVPVIVTKAGQKVIWGENGAVVTTVDTSNLSAHETSENSQVLSPTSVVTAQGYELTDGKLSTTATPINIDPSTVSWTTTPDTTVETANIAGKQISTSVNIDFTNNDAARNILGSKNGIVTTDSFTIDAKGAGAKSVSTPVKIALGSDLTGEQFDQLVDNNIPANEIATTTWATKPDENGNGGVIKITFKDDAANGQPTYLNITIPSSSVDITTNADQYTPEGQQVSTKVGETPDASQGISNKNTLPDGTKYTWETAPDTTTPGKKPVVVVVTYPDGSKDNVPTTVVVNAKPEIKPISTTVGQIPEATQGIANLNNGGSTPVDGYPSGATWVTAPDISKPGTTTGTAKVTYPDGTTETVTIPVAVSDNQDVTIIDDKGHSYSLHAKNVITHKTSDRNIIGAPVIENFKLSYYEGGQNYSKPYIYTLNSDGTAYELTQTGDNPVGVTVNAPQSVPVSEISSIWTPIGAEFGIPGVTGQGQPSSLVSDKNNGTKTITYTGQDNTQGNPYVYPMYSATVDTSKVNWPIFGKGPKAQHPFPFVYIYGAEANGTIPSVNSDVSDLRTALGDASKVVNTADLTQTHNSEISSIDWQTLPSLEKANAQAPATVRINFTDGSYLDVPVAVNVIKVDQGIDDKDNHDIYRDITRTITVEGQDTPVVQHVIYSRAKITDLAKPEGQQVTYTANEHTLVITYVDSQTGKQVGSRYNVSGKTGEEVSVDVAGNVPTNWKLVPNQNVISSYKFGSDDPTPVTYKVEHNTENVPVDKTDSNTYREVNQTIYEIPAGKTEADKTVVRAITVPFQRTGTKDLVTGDITWNDWQGPTGSFDKDHVSTYELPAFEVSQVTGYDSYVNGSKAIQVGPVDVNADSQNVIDTITYIKQDSTPVPYKPGKEGVNDEMNKYVTRTIIVKEPGKPESRELQVVHFTNEDKNGNSGYKDPVTGEVTYNSDWHVAGNLEAKTGTWAEFNAPEVTDYTANPEKVAEETVTSDTKDISVTITYTKNGDTPVPFDPSNENMYREITRTIIINMPDQGSQTKLQTVKFTREDKKHNAGYTDPVTGKTTLNAWHIVNGVATTGTWTEFNAPQVEGYTPTPDTVSAETVTPETKDVSVIISYSRNDIPKTPSDADKYTPEGQDVHTKPGVVPPAEKGIKNKDDMPDGTKYTWEKTPDVTNPGTSTGTIIVTYPDGSQDKVDVHVVVDKTPSDADKYTPEGQDVHTTPGVVPPAEKGIKNKDDMPDGTKYTWEKTPDVTNPGTSTGTIIVTYPDGSQDKVDVHVVVDKTPSDADKYTPEGQDVHTTPGVVPPAEKGIKIKDDMPSGTKYTWEKTPDVTKPGKTTGTVIVTYPDGSKDKVNVTVIIGTNHVTPEPQPIHTNPGVVPNPSEGIKNKNDMPEGTKYTWKEVPDVSTIGEHTGVVTVTYPDGSSVDVTVKVYVDATGTSDNNGGKTTETNSEANTAKAATVNGNHHAEKNTLPQTGAKSENTAGILGLAIAAVGSLFGLGVDRKKRQK